MRYSRFQDIPQFKQSGQWECDFTIHRVPTWVDEMIECQGLDLDPDFQREHVWTGAQQRAWLEYFLKGGKTGRTLYFNAPWWGRDIRAGGDFVIVDGKQRLQAIRQFINNQIAVFGSYFCEFSDRPRSATHTIRLNVNDLPTRLDVIQWYLDMNTGGVVHTEREIGRVKNILETERAKRVVRWSQPEAK